MKKPKASFVISRYKEDPSWIKNYTDDYIIYNKGEPLDDNFNAVKRPNIGGNQYDIAYFIHENYNNLPDLMAFVQGDPFDHCKKEKFDQIIYNEEFTSLESYEHLENTFAHIIDTDGGYTEINNSWFILPHNQTHNLTCKYVSYHHFMRETFEDYDYPNYIRFCPGSQYLVTKQQALQHPKNFWKYIMDQLPENNMTEAHIVERAFLYILTGRYQVKDFLR